MRLNPFSRKHYCVLIVYENGMKRWLRLEEISLRKVMGPLYFSQAVVERFKLRDAHQWQSEYQGHWADDTIAPPSELDADFPERRLK